MKKVLVLFIVFCLSGIFALSQNTSVPQLVNYQGYLTDEEGKPLKTAEYNLTVKIFNSSTPKEKETPLWTKTMEKVPVIRGQFNVILGIDDNRENITEAFKSKDAFLEITVGDGEPILPRQQVLSTPYAIQAEYAANAANAADCVRESLLQCYGGRESDLVAQTRRVPDQIGRIVGAIG